MPRVKIDEAGRQSMQERARARFGPQVSVGIHHGFRNRRSYVLSIGGRIVEAFNDVETLDAVSVKEVRRTAEDALVEAEEVIGEEQARATKLRDFLGITDGSRGGE